MPPTSCRNDPPAGRRRPDGAAPAGWLRLASGIVAILVLWLAILPRIADQTPIRQHIEFLEQRQIDPSAMFYTELEPMAEVRTRIARIRNQHPASFWTPTPGSAGTASQ